MLIYHPCVSSSCWLNAALFKAVPIASPWCHFSWQMPINSQQFLLFSHIFHDNWYHMAMTALTEISLFGPFCLIVELKFLQITYFFLEILSFYILKRKLWRIQDFPEVAASTLQTGRQHAISPNFPKNCMKLKEFGPLGGPWHPP